MTQPVTAPEQMVKSKPCAYCKTAIIWMRAYPDGQRMPFDATPVDRTHDDGLGWAPGVFTLRGQPRRLLAPLPLHDDGERHRHATVLHIHTCPGLRR